MPHRGCCTRGTVTERLSFVNEYSWEGISPEAQFLWGERAKEIGDRPVDSDDANDLPLARLAREHGFEVAPDAPMWLFLPVVWPIADRAWIRDNRLRHLQTYVDGQLVDVPWSTADYFGAADDERDFLAALLPLPKRPPGRVWLLRAPRDHTSIDETVRQMSDSSWAAGAHPDQNEGDLFPFLQHCEYALKGFFGHD